MRTVRIEVSPFKKYEQPVNAGVMFEHRAAMLEFVLNEEYIKENYKYYIEFAMPAGVARTDYLEPDANGVITYEIPNTVTSQMSALCYFNIITIDEQTYATTLVIKPVEVKLTFDSVASTDEALSREYSFSVNALLEMVKNGGMSGEIPDGSISFEKFDENVQEAFEDLSLFLEELEEDAEKIANKTQDIADEFEFATERYPSAQAVKDYVADYSGPKYRPQLIKRFTLDHTANEYIFDLNSSSNAYEFKEFYLQMDIPYVASEQPLGFFVKNNGSQWFDIAGQNSGLKIYSEAQKHTVITMKFTQYGNVYWYNTFGCAAVDTAYGFNGAMPALTLKASGGATDNFDEYGVIALKVEGNLPIGTAFRLWGLVKQ